LKNNSKIKSTDRKTGKYQRTTMCPQCGNRVPVGENVVEGEIFNCSICGLKFEAYKVINGIIILTRFQKDSR